VAHREVRFSSVRLHYVEAGEGPLVVLLHGFPEHWIAWRHQIPALLAAGHRVVAPDLRGYNLSDKPRRVRDYRARLLARDVAELLDALGSGSAHVVGHDWGGSVAWWFAMYHPERVDRLVVLNSPHPVGFLRALATPAQLRKSWYMFFFQLPWLPERLVRADDFRRVRRTLRDHPVRPDAFSEHDIDRYVAALSQPGALRGGINYYRAAFRTNPFVARPTHRRIDVPILVIWGEQDRYLEPEVAEPDPSWVADVQVERIPDASHWVLADAPGQVNQLLLAFLDRRTA
jgi:epoxide hydrolase 4